jgi:hypothetical protein
MKILFINVSSCNQTEIEDFFQQVEISFANEENKAIKMLNQWEFQVVIFCIKQFSEFGLVGYIRNYFPQTKLILSMPKQMKKIIEIVTNNEFSILDNPISLKQLKKYYNTI